MRRLIFTILIICLGANLSALENGQIRFNPINDKTGMSHNGIISVFQDHEGCMWFGSRYGLNRYDGFEITSFHKGQYKESLSGNTISDIFEDHSKNMWIVTNEGITLYSPTQKQFFNLKYILKNNILNRPVGSIQCIDSAIYITNNEGLWRITPPLSPLTDISIQQINCEKISIPDTLFPFKIKGKDARGNLLFTANNSIIIGKIENNMLSVVDHISINNGDKIEIPTLYCDKSSNIWVGTSMHGLYSLRFNNDKYHVRNVTLELPNNTKSFERITSIIQDNNNNLWISSRSHGVVVISNQDLSSDKLRAYALSDTELSTRKIKCMYLSRDNTMWLGSLGNGVFSYNAHNNKFKNYRLSESRYRSSMNYVRSVTKDSYDRLWIGTLYNGMYIQTLKQNQVENLMLDNTSVFSFSKVDNNRIMAGTSRGLYLFHYDQSKIEKTLLISREQINGAIFSITNKGDKYWIGTSEKLISFNLSPDNKVTNYSSISNKLLFDTNKENTIRIVKYDMYRNCLWIGSEISGLSRALLDRNDNIDSIILIDNKVLGKEMIDNHICDIEIDQDRICWVATHNGLIRFELKGNGDIVDSKYLTVENGLPSNMIQSIVSDSADNLWMGSNKGLAKLDKKSFETITYNKKDGVQEGEFSEHASCMDSKGYLYFGGINGISEISGESIKANSFVGKVIINDIKVNGTSVSPKNNLQLKSSENNLKFSFIAYNFTNPERCQYAYMLEGYDKEWNYTSGENRLAEYVNLKRGTYKFKIKAANEDQTWREDAVEIDVEIAPSFWVTPIAFLLYLTIVFLIAYIIVMITKSLVKRKQAELYKVQYLKDRNQLSQSKLQFFINISHEMRTSLTLMTCSLEKLISHVKITEEQDKEVLLINSNINRILRLINELIEVRKIETGNYQLNVRKENPASLINNIASAFRPLAEKNNQVITLNLPEKQIIGWIDSNAVEKVFSNLVSNAIKYTPHGGKITITMTLEEPDEVLKISVVDNGIGINKSELTKIFDQFYNSQGNKDAYEKGFGIGLYYTKTLIELHKGSIDVDSEPGKGTCFTITLPVREDSYSKEEKIDKYFKDTNLDLIFENMGQTAGEEEKDDSLIYYDSSDSNKLTILLVDDNKDIRTNFGEYLSETYNVLLASNGKQGYERAAKYQPEIILSDVVMPEMDGIELCRTLKNDINTSHIPLVLLTAKGDDDTHLMGIESGADYFLPKPFNIKLLDLIIENLIKSRESVKSAFLSNEQLDVRELIDNSKDELFVNTIIDYIHEHISDSELKINNIADVMNMSRSTFFRKIKAVTGITGKELIDSIRLKKAIQMLVETDLNISEIAYEIGYSNPLYFSKWFKSHCNVSPSEYIKQNRQTGSNSKISVE
ncbi:MAG: two-component regulator propeller domain-containing protein [Bacteroidales bacterium]